MAEIVDFGLQQHKIKMDSRYFENVLSVVAGDTGRRLEVQLLDTNGMVQNTTGLNLRLNAEIAGKATFTDATLVDAATGKYQLDLSNGMFLAPGNWQFQWQITDSAGKKLHSFAFTGNVGKNISEGGSQATNFYLNLEDLKKMQDDLINGTIDSSILETNITEKLTNLETQYAPKLTEVTAQLAQTENQVFKNSRMTTIGKGSKPKYVTFIADDGRGGELALAQTFINNNVPMCGCIITDNADEAVTGEGSILSWEEIKNLQDNHGFEYGGHTVNVQNNLISDALTEEETRYQLKESKRIIEEKLNSECSYFVYPQGASNTLIRECTRDYYRCAFNISGGINKNPMPMYGLWRHDTSGVSSADLKASVDVLNESDYGWLVFMIHTDWDKTTDPLTPIISDVITHIKSLGIEIVTVSKALEFYENVVETGDFTKSPHSTNEWTSTNTFHVVSKTGEEYNSYEAKLRNTSLDRYKIAINSSTLPKRFEPYSITSTPITVTNKSEFPELGNLLTYATNERVNYGWMYQKLIGLSGNEYIRHSDSNGLSWGLFKTTSIKQIVGKYTLASTTVNANSYVDVDITVPGVTIDMACYIGGFYNIPQNIVYFANNGKNGRITLRLANLSATAITIPETILTYRVTY